MLLAILLTCSKYDEIACKASENRLQSIRDQRKVLLELRKIDKIGKKKFLTVDGILSEEEAVESLRFDKRCKNENN